MGILEEKDPMPKINKYYVYALVAAVIYAGGYYQGTGDKEVVVKEKIKYVVDENIKEVITERPDGTKVTERETVRREQGESDKTSVTKPVSDKWRVAVMGSFEADKEADSVYTLSVQRRLLPNLYAGFYGRTDEEVGISIGFSF